MKTILIYILLLFLPVNILASDIVDLAGEVRIPVPENWDVSGDSGKFPFQIINQEQSAELLIYKSLIDKEQRVTNERELKESVYILVEDVILTLPEAKILTNTGRIDENRAIFSVEFVSTDTSSAGKVFHRLSGILYDHPNGEQLFFILWGKTNQADKDILQNEISFMQSNFSYYGESNSIIFPIEEYRDWQIYILVLFIIVLTLFIFKKYKSSDKINFSEESHFWRCSCGRQNHNSQDACRRCGKKHEITESV